VLNAELGVEEGTVTSNAWRLAAAAASSGGFQTAEMDAPERRHALGAHGLRRWRYRGDVGMPPGPTIAST
jgi:hypothetical protein